MPTTRALVERLRMEPTLRRLCGWEAAGGVPSEATFSRAFGEFAASDLPGRLHEALLDRPLQDHLAGHLSRDSTAIAGRESPAPKPALTARPKRRRGRPPKGEQRPKGAAPPAAAGVDEAGGDAEGVAKGLRHRRQAQRQGASGRAGSATNCTWTRSTAGFRSVVCSPRRRCMTVKWRSRWRG